MFHLPIVKDYLKHRLKAKTRHGLHSPFVYRLVDEVVYDFSEKKVISDLETQQISVNQRQRVKKLNRLLFRLMADRQLKHLVLLGNVSSSTQAYMQMAAADVTISYQLDNSPAKLDVVLIDIKNDTEAREYFERCLPHIDEHTLIILKNIYFTNGLKMLWHDIKANQQVTVTVDLFMVGLIYFRKGQAREDFWIRF